MFDQGDEIILETPRLIMRELCKNDWKEAHLYSTDKDVVKFMPWGPNTEVNTRTFIDRVLKERLKTHRKEYHFAVIEKGSGNMIGAVELALKGHEDTNGMLGYCFAKSAWGRGLGTEAVEALIRFAFEKLQIHRVWADCDTENFGSQRVLEKNGMRREGCFIKKSFIKGEWRDDYHYAILRDEWVKEHE